MLSDPGARRARFQEVVEVVYEPLQRYALRRCDRATAEDVVADTLLVLWRRLDDVPGEAVLPWSYRVAANVMANARRSESRRTRLHAKVVALDPPAQATWDPEPPDPDLHDALATLPPAEAEVLRLWAWESLTPAEIAGVLDTTANAVSIRLHRAKARLAAALERTGNDPDTKATRTKEVT